MGAVGQAIGGWAGATLAATPLYSARPVWAVVGLIVAALFLALYVYAPLVISGQQAKPLEAEFTPIDPQELPPDVQRVFADASASLASLDFRCLGHVVHRAGRTGQDAFAGVWTQPTSKDMAQVIGVLTPTPLPSLAVVTLVTFRTEFTDRTAFVTSNSPNTGCFAPDPAVRSIRCPGVHDLGRLYQFHRARVSALGGRRTATLDRCTDAVRRLVAEHRETFQRLTSAGEYRLDAGRQQWVPTLKGAFLMTYRLLPPWKQLRRLNRDWAANRALRDLGFGNLDTFRQGRAA